jgi:hypothetical protein
MNALVPSIIVSMQGSYDIRSAVCKGRPVHTSVGNACLSPEQGSHELGVGKLTAIGCGVGWSAATQGLRIEPKPPNVAKSKVR